MTVFLSGRGAITRNKAVGGGGVTAPNNAAAATEYASDVTQASYNNITPTVHADTELLVVIAGGVRDATGITSITLSSDVDGALSAKIDPSDPGAGRSFAGVWFIHGPTDGAHVITLTKNGGTGGNLTCMWAVVLQLKDVDTAPFETDFDYTTADVAPGASALTMNGSIAPDQDNSLVVAFAAVEDPTRTGPFTFNESLVLVHEGDTGTGTGVDQHYGVGTKVQATAGASAWEIVATATDDWAAGAIAVRGKVA